MFMVLLKYGCFFLNCLFLETAIIHIHRGVGYDHKHGVADIAIRILQAEGVLADLIRLKTPTDQM
jgi:hypothetical protein